MVQARQTAYKVWIGSILEGEFHKVEGEWEPNYVLINDKRVSRVNIIATTISKLISDDGGSGSVEVDDGSGNIRVKAWKEDVNILKKVEVGNLVLLIGRVRSFNNENYVTPEIIRVLPDPSWANIRRIELEKEYGKFERSLKEENSSSLPQQTSDETVGGEKKAIEETIPVVTESKRQKILNLIGKEEEVNYDNIVSESGIDKEEASKIINDLLKEGEIYQSRPGFLKII